MVNSLLASRSLDINARLARVDRPPALVHAARRGDRAIVETLLRADARIDGVDARGLTACHVAARGHHDTLALLLAHRPNLALRDASRSTSFQIAMEHCTGDDGRAALMLLAAGAPLGALSDERLCCFAASSTAAIQALRDRGVVISQLRGLADGTALHAAFRFMGDLTPVLRMLVDVCGVDLEARNSFGRTCTHVATSYRNAAALRWLVCAGADVNSVCDDGATPLHSVGDYDCAVCLLAAGADARARDRTGRMALHDVARVHERPLAHVFLAADGDLDATDDAGNTARQEFARRGWTVDADKVEAARREIAIARVDFVRRRALEVCIGIQSLELDALQMCQILLFACGRVAQMIPFHVWWSIATTVKHFEKKETKQKQKQKKKIRIRKKKETNEF